MPCIATLCIRGGGGGYEGRERSKEVSAYGEFTTVMSEERYLVEGLTAMGYRVEVHADGAALVDYHGDERQEKAHVIIRRAQLDSASNDIGFVRGKDGRYQAILSE